MRQAVSWFLSGKSVSYSAEIEVKKERMFFLKEFKKMFKDTEIYRSKHRGKKCKVREIKRERERERERDREREKERRFKRKS